MTRFELLLELSVLMQYCPDTFVLNFLLCAANGLKYYDLEEGGGFGAPVQKGDSVTVSHPLHCIEPSPLKGRSCFCVE